MRKTRLDETPQFFNEETDVLVYPGPKDNTLSIKLLTKLRTTNILASKTWYYQLGSS